MFRPSAAFVACCVAAAVLGVLVLTFPLGTLQALDQPTDAALAWTAKQPGVVGASKVLDFMGSIEFVGVALAGLVALLLWERRVVEAGLAVAAFGSAELLTDALKVLFERARPVDRLLETTSASFPSGHAMRGAILAVLFGAYAWHRLDARPRLRNGVVAAIAAWGGAMVVARLALHVHWLSDVVAGAAAGVAFGAAAIALAPLVLTTRVPVGQPVAVTARAGSAAPRAPPALQDAAVARAPARGSGSPPPP